VRQHAQLDNLVGDDKVFITGEARSIDRMLLTYENPNAKRLYLLHNAHLKAPCGDRARIKPAYRALLERHRDVSATVFLTDTQRADAELQYGRQPNFFVIPHPAPPVTLDRGIERDPNLVVMIARIDYLKRQDHAIKAFARVLEDVPDARLELYGTGPEEAQYQRLIDRLGVGASVTLAGYTDNVGEILQQAALSVLTSRLEGFPLAVMESLNRGCPVLAYDVRYGPSDIIADGVNGILIEKGDVASLAHEIVRVLTNRALRQRLSHAALGATDAFSPEVFVARWSALFNSIAGEDSATTAVRGA